MLQVTQQPVNSDCNVVTFERPAYYFLTVDNLTLKDLSLECHSNKASIHDSSSETNGRRMCFVAPRPTCVLVSIFGADALPVASFRHCSP